MNNSDIGIINSGLIKYETSIIGLPCISFSNRVEDNRLMNFFDQKKMLIHLGILKKSNEKIFIQKLEYLINNYEFRNKISRNCISNFDGLGKNRIFKLIF